MQGTLPEGTARAAQLAPSAQSEDLHQKCGWPSLSDDERLVEKHARLRGVGIRYRWLFNPDACKSVYSFTYPPTDPKGTKTLLPS